MMGCGASMETNSVVDEATNQHNGPTHLQQNGTQPKDIVQEYVELDERISKLESTCPGPRMATSEAWIEHLQTKRTELLGLNGMEPNWNGQQTDDQTQQQDTVTNNGEMHGLNMLNNETTMPQTITPLREDDVRLASVHARHTTNDLIINTPTKDLANLAYSLDVISDVRKASTHEDFFANLSESVLYLLSIRYITEILEHTKVRFKKLMTNYAELNELYVNQDGIIAYLSGGTYISRLEENIDAQLERARDVRDKLGSAMEQWHISGTLLRTSATAATHMLLQWRQLASIVDPKHKIETALMCRSTLHASLTSLECAQLALPYVELKHISNRQILAVKHCSTYLITDIANVSRYEHTTKVFATYKTNLSKASTWLQDTFNKTLMKDFDKAEQTVHGLAKTLRDHRKEIFTAASK